MKQKKSLYFLGDSITDAGHLWEDSGECLGDGYVRRIQEMLDGTSFRCVNKGQDGFTSRDLHRLVKQEKLPEDLAAITILIGVNDLSVSKYGDPNWLQREYPSNLEEILGILRRSFDGPILLMEPFLFPKPDELTHLLPGLMWEHQTLKALAAQWQCSYLPLQEQLLLLTRLHGQDKLSTDGIHLTEWGGKKLAEQWMSVWKKVKETI